MQRPQVNYCQRGKVSCTCVVSNIILDYLENKAFVLGKSFTCH